MVIRIPDQKIYAMFFFHQFRRKICWHQQIQHSTSNDTWDVQGSVDVRHDVVGTCWNILKTNKWQTNNKKCQHVVLMSFRHSHQKKQWKDFTRSLLLNDVILKFLTRCPKLCFLFVFGFRRNIASHERDSELQSFTLQVDSPLCKAMWRMSVCSFIYLPFNQFWRLADRWNQLQIMQACQCWER